MTVQQTSSSMPRVLAASLVGSALEWFDYFLYGTAAALVFNHIMFPKTDPFVATLLAYSTLALGFLVRPIGAIYFGALGDRIGRKKVLIITLLLMGVSTTLIGCVPSYESIGVWAPISLVVLRLIQGFGAGAEFGGAVIITVENSAKRRGLFGAFPGIGVYLGLLMGAGVFSLLAMLPHESFMSWGWRLPFLSSILLIGVALVIRVKLTETNAFEELEKANAVSRHPLRDLLKAEKKNLAIVAGSQVAQSGVSYVYQTFVIGYIATVLAMAPSVGTTGVAVAAAVAVFTTPLFGAISDVVGRRPVYLFGALFSAAFAFPFFALVRSGSELNVILAMSLGIGVGIASMLGVQGAFFSEIFSAKIRFSGLALGREISASLAGGFAPMAAVALSGHFNNETWPVALLAVALSLITVVAVALAPETQHRNIAEDVSDGWSGRNSTTDDVRRPAASPGALTSPHH